MELTNFQILLAVLIGGSVLLLNILKAIKLWKDMRSPDSKNSKPKKF